MALQPSCSTRLTPFPAPGRGAWGVPEGGQPFLLIKLAPFLLIKLVAFLLIKLVPFLLIKLVPFLLIKFICLLIGEFKTFLLTLLITEL